MASNVILYDRMAKSSSKVEDYWRQNNVENLLKEVTQLLARRMPPDPALAIVEYLQKKFPKSFKHSTQSESQNDSSIERRSSSQSQSNGTVSIPSVGSAFTDLLKQQTSNARPETIIKNLVFANRFGHQMIKMRKDIRSDRDILDEESIKPAKISSTNAVPDDLRYTETTEELSVPQLIKYKQQIHMEHDRRIHREQLAALAKNQREKEKFIRSDLSAKPEELEQQKMEEENDDEASVPTETKTDVKLSQKPSVKSKEEEDILNDENVFQPRKQRDRIRQRNRLSTPRFTVPCIRGGSVADIRSTMMRKDDEPIICKVCGNLANGREQDHHQQNTVRSFQPLSVSQSVETTTGTIDDWFAPASDQTISPPTGSKTFRRNLFQSNNDIVEHRPLISTDDDETKGKRLATPRIAESGVFARSPSPSSSNTTRQISGRNVRKHSPDDSD